MSLFRRLRPTGLLIATIIVAACGFQPLYGSSQGVLSGAVVENLAAVRITAIPDRVGQIVRNDLLDRLNDLIADYNAGSQNIEELFDALQEIGELVLFGLELFVIGNQIAAQTSPPKALLR